MLTLTVTRAQRLHRNDKFWGAVAEALVAAYAMIGAGGKLTSYRPSTDVDGKDIIIDLAGGFKDIYLQVKCAIGINRNHRIGGTVRLHKGEIPTSPKLVYVFCLLDRPGMQLARIWVVPSRSFYRRAYRTNLANDMVQFNFDCDTRGDSRWDPYEVSRDQLGLRIVELIRSASGGKGRAKAGSVGGEWLRLAA